MARHPRQQPAPRLKQTAKTYKEVINVQLRLHKEGKLFFSLSVCESHVRAREDRAAHDPYYACARLRKSPFARAGRHQGWVLPASGLERKFSITASVISLQASV